MVTGIFGYYKEGGGSGTERRVCQGNQWEERVKHILIRFARPNEIQAKPYDKVVVTIVKNGKHIEREITKEEALAALSNVSAFLGSSPLQVSPEVRAGLKKTQPDRDKPKQC